MRLGIKGKQIAGVTAIVGVAVTALSGLYLTRLSALVLHESHARGQLLSSAIFHRAREVVTSSSDPYTALRDDPGMRSILESSIYGESVTGAHILDPGGIVVASSDPSRVGEQHAGRPDLAELVQLSGFQQLRVIYNSEGQTLEVRQPMTLGTDAFGSIRIGVSTLLMRQELNAALRPALITAAVSLLIAVIVAGLLAQLLLKPIHVLRSGLTRLGRGETGVTLDLPPGDEFGELGDYFNTVSQQLSDERTHAADVTQSDVTLQTRVDRALAYSQKLVALGRLTAGIAHEVKNPLNAMMIHLELLRTKIRSGALSHASEPDALQHVEVIESAVRRLDEVVQGFLKFTRPEDLQLQPVSIPLLFQELLPLIEPEAQARGVKIVLDAPMTLPDVQGDAAMLRQAVLNLAMNACQAMTTGGTLRLVASPASQKKVEVRVEDTGIGIPPEQLGKIFDLYYTTKDRGTGLGLSMVYRIIQMHDGELEVQSTPGHGTSFKILLPRSND